MEDKRRFTRIPFKEAIQYRTPGQSEAEACIACDLSEVGIRLNSFRFIPLRERMALTVQLDQEAPITVQGHVIWVQRVPHSEFYQVGLAFDPDTNDETLHELQKYIQTH
jgi:hypothetical protein